LGPRWRGSVAIRPLPVGRPGSGGRLLARASAAVGRPESGSRYAGSASITGIHTVNHVAVHTV